MAHDMEAEALLSRPLSPAAGMHQTPPTAQWRHLTGEPPPTSHLLVESATKGLKRGRHCREESSPNACQQMPLLALMLSLQTVIPNLKHTKKIYKISQFSENITYPKNWVILRV